MALFFALCVALRDAPFLIALDLLATLGLLLLAANYRGAALARLPGGRLLTRAAIATAEISLRPMPLALQSLGSVRITTEQTRRLVPVGRGVMLAAPVLIVFTGLLMAADSVFASYVIQAFSLELPFDPSAILAHATIAGTVTWLYAGGALTALSHVALAFPQQHIQMYRICYQYDAKLYTLGSIIVGIFQCIAHGHARWNDVTRKGHEIEYPRSAA